MSETIVERIEKGENAYYFIDENGAEIGPLERRPDSTGMGYYFIDTNGQKQGPFVEIKDGVLYKGKYKDNNWEDMVEIHSCCNSGTFKIGEYRQGKLQGDYQVHPIPEKQPEEKRNVIIERIEITSNNYYFIDETGTEIGPLTRIDEDYDGLSYYYLDSEGKKQGPFVKFNEWGSNKGFYKDNEYDGTVERYYKGCDYFETSDYVKGKLHGYFKCYHGGKLECVAYYVNGMQEGIEKGWDNKGNLKYIYRYENDRRIERILLYPDGTLYAHSINDRDTQDAAHKIYAPDGKILESFTTNGKNIHGLHERYLPDGYTILSTYDNGTIRDV